MLEKEENEMMALMGCCRCGGRERSNRWRGRSAVERIVAEGTVEKEKEERETTEKEKNRGEAGFLSTLNSIFFLFKP
jgi:hypothetical protein